MKEDLPTYKKNRVLDSSKFISDTQNVIGILKNEQKRRGSNMNNMIQKQATPPEETDTGIEEKSKLVGFVDLGCEHYRIVVKSFEDAYDLFVEEAHTNALGELSWLDVEDGITKEEVVAKYLFNTKKEND